MHDNLDFSKYKGFCQKQSLWGLISVFSDPPCYQNILQTYSYLQNLHPHAAPVFFHLLVWAGGGGQCVGQDVGFPGWQFLHLLVPGFWKVTIAFSLVRSLSWGCSLQAAVSYHRKFGNTSLGFLLCNQIDLKSIQQFQSWLLGERGKRWDKSHLPYFDLKNLLKNLNRKTLKLRVHVRYTNHVLFPRLPGSAVLTGSAAACESWVLSTLESQMIWIQVA